MVSVLIAAGEETVDLIFLLVRATSEGSFDGSATLIGSAIARKLRHLSINRLLTKCRDSDIILRRDDP